MTLIRKTEKDLFLQYVAQTSPSPPLLEIERAEGIYLYDRNGKQYIDFISGISTCNVGHRHPKVLETLRKQMEKYLHVMVYGEYVLSPQVQLAKRLTELLPQNLDCVYFVNSGTEANETALTLARKVTGRKKFFSFHHAYHGSTFGSESILGDAGKRKPYEPLLPEVFFLEFNDPESSGLEKIDKQTAAVIIEPIQGEGGINVAEKKFLQRLRKKCDDAGALLIFDEVQTGFGRTGKFFCFEHSGVVPDILTLAKGMGVGMPIGACISSREKMKHFSDNPPLNHLTTFGGHPLSCAASLAGIEIIFSEKLLDAVPQKEKFIRENLVHPAIREIRGKGLMLGAVFQNGKILQKIIQRCRENRIIVDWFLFADSVMRLAPPLTITMKELETSVRLILKSIKEVYD